VTVLFLCLGTGQFAACAPLTPGTRMPPTQIPDSLYTNVLSVEVSGEPGAYQFAVEIDSPDTGCEQYTDWWEVITEDGQLVYRRILLHSHVDEQPFTRTGGPVAAGPDTVLWVRAHLNTGGYGGQALRGSPKTGFIPAPLEATRFSDLEQVSPQPESCAF
jgi:hypothetical protein